MKYLTLLVVSVLFSTNTFCQKGSSEKVISLMDSYWKEMNPETLKEATALIDKVFAKPGALENKNALYAKSQVLTASFTSEEYEAPEDLDAYLKTILDINRKALKADAKNTNRFKILNNLYKIKNQMTVKGSESYVEQDFETATKYYKSATELNDLEVDFPRLPVIDTSTFYTAAVTARLAGLDEEAIKLFERVTEMEYNREDAYDQLINLYKKGYFDVKARKLEAKKAKLFPK